MSISALTDFIEVSGLIGSALYVDSNSENLSQRNACRSIVRKSVDDSRRGCEDIMVIRGARGARLLPVDIDKTVVLGLGELHPRHMLERLASQRKTHANTRDRERRAGCVLRKAQDNRVLTAYLDGSAAAAE